MKQVWVVTDWYDYNAYSVLKVFSSEARAKAWSEKEIDNRFHMFDLVDLIEGPVPE